MDHQKLILLVYEHPALWDRNHNQFRNSDVKTHFWDKIGHSLGSNGPTCKDAFKALREKYVREKEKCMQYGNSFKKWELYDAMAFLDPHIVLRKGNSFSSSQDIRIKEDTDQSPQLDVTSPEYLTETLNQDLIKELISLVKNSRVIWDKRHLNHGDAKMREYLWKNIGQKLNTDANICKLRWKALREKYIRQKHRQSYGDVPKWQFMDDMSFLDNVIQFRKNRWVGQCSDTETNMYNNQSTTSEVENDDQTSDSYQEPSSFKYCFQSTQEEIPYVHDIKSTPDSTLEPKRRRTDSESMDQSNNKRENNIEENQTSKSPEQIFGEFVTAMLSNKLTKDKNRIMMKIMSILTEPSD